MADTRLFPTQEIGSIAKPSWRVKGVSSDARVGPADIEEAEKWGQFLSVPNYAELVDLLKKLSSSKKAPTREQKDIVRNFSVNYVLALFEKADLDRVYTGEQWRVEMYEHLVRNIKGFKLLGSVHSFDYKYFTKGAVVARPAFKHPIHLDEFQFIKSQTKKEIKVPITGPYTVVDWSFNEFYEKQVRRKAAVKERIDLRKTYYEARRNFILDLVKKALRPEVEILIKSGVKWIQIDEPAITTRPDDEEMEMFVEATNELTRGFTDCTFSIHNCYSDYKLLARYSAGLKGIKQLALEFANRDSSDLGTDPKSRPGFVGLKDFLDEGFNGGFGVGVTHVHDFTGEPGNGATREGRNIIESPELVRDRILCALEILKDPQKISVNPDCGLRTRNWDITYRKLDAMREGTRLAREKVS